MTNSREECLKQVREAVCSDRNRDYGDPEDNFLDIANILNVLLRDKLHPEHELHPTDIALIMITTKLARAKTSPYKLDHYVDMAGYAVCGYACVEKQHAEEGLKPGQIFQGCPKCNSYQRLYDERNPGWHECMNCGCRYKVAP
jgi:hypothetical protein